LTDRTSAEIVAGLKVGDRVIVDTPAESGRPGGTSGGQRTGLGFRL
jgi:hypothetical protein